MSPALPAQWSGAGYTASGRAYYSSTEGYYLYFDPNCNGATDKWHIVYGEPSTTASSNLHSSCGQFQIAYATDSMFFYTTSMVRSVSATCNGVASTSYNVRAQASAPTVDSVYLETQLDSSCYDQLDTGGPLNRFYVYGGRTASGSPWYATPDTVGMTKYYLWYDPACVTHISNVHRWAYGTTAPNTTATSGIGCGAGYLGLSYKSSDPAIGRRDVPYTSGYWSMTCTGTHGFYGVTNRMLPLSRTSYGVGADTSDAMYYTTVTSCTNFNYRSGSSTNRHFYRAGFLANGAKVYICANCGGSHSSHTYLTWDPSCNGAANVGPSLIMWSITDYNVFPAYYDGVAGTSISTSSLYSVSGSCSHRAASIGYSYRREMWIGSWSNWYIDTTGCNQFATTLTAVVGNGGRVAGRRLAELRNVSARVGGKDSARNGSVLR
jgi:hypothetical protein